MCQNWRSSAAYVFFVYNTTGYMAKLIRVLFEICLVCLMLGIIIAAGAIAYLLPGLPSKQEISDVRLQVPLRVYSSSGTLIGTFGDKKRVPVSMENIPEKIRLAVLAAEDSRFYEHPGVDWRAIARATLSLVRHGQIRQGGSTITMQVARNYFLSREKTFHRKAREILLALRIEQQFSKDKILELYLNKIFFGHRSYGIAAATETYYGGSMDELSLAQMAMLAGLPQRPSDNNPISNPEAALKRRKYVLNRMLALGHISQDEYNEAVTEAATAKPREITAELYAPYAADMVRSAMIGMYGEKEALTGNFQVHTSIDDRMQYAANAAVRNSLLEYSDRRSGYRGPARRNAENATKSREEQLELLSSYPAYGDLLPVLVQSGSGSSASVIGRGIGQATLALGDMLQAGITGNNGQQATTDGTLQPGDIVYVREDASGLWQLVSLPEVEGGFIALSPNNGGILAVAGGFDFKRSQFNRAIQANRQPGSGIKPFLYSAALEAGYTAASTINDAPIVYDEVGADGDDWKPKNYSGKTYGPTRLRVALAKSRNLVSVRLLDDLGMPFTKAYLQRFGFDPDELPEGMSMALGSQAVTMLDMARAYSVFANGGYLVNPHIISHIDQHGETVFTQPKAEACPEQNTDCPPAPPEYQKIGYPFLAETVGEQRWAPRVLSPANAWLMNSIMKDVINRGTATRARQLERSDLAGKTGTTNDQRDAWFFGFNPSLTAVGWVGFDDYSPLGRGETGSRAALPMWMDFMRQVLPTLPEAGRKQPPGMTSVLIDAETGEIASPQSASTIRETFRARYAPVKHVSAKTAQDNPEDSSHYRQIF